MRERKETFSLGLQAAGEERVVALEAKWAAAARVAAEMGRERSLMTGIEPFDR